MRIRLTVKLAEVVEGVDLSVFAEGDVIELAERDANLLIAGGWAQRIPQEERVMRVPDSRPALAADRAVTRARRTRSRE